MSYRSLPNAISPEYADHLVEELLVLEPEDLTQIRRAMNRLSDDDLTKLRALIKMVTYIVKDVRYLRKPDLKSSTAQKYRDSRVRQIKEAEEGKQ